MSRTHIDKIFSSLEEALQGTTAPLRVQENLVLVPVRHVSFDGLIHGGQLVVHRDIEEDIRALFAHLLEVRFPVQRAVPISAYNWNDDASMAANNSSSFNYRLILGTDRLSEHSHGLAVDLNPLQNPYFARDGKVYPEGAVYDTHALGTLLADGPAVTFLKSRGFEWGGDWITPVDYQHFQKRGHVG